MERPSFLLDIPSDEYHLATKNNRFLTSHRCMVLRKDPLEYKQRCDGIIVDKDTATFVLGRATHTYILEGEEKFNAEFVVSDGPINEKTGKPFGKATDKYRSWYEEQKKPVISSDDFAQIRAMNDSVQKHLVAADLIKEGIAEGTIRTLWNGIAVQTRMDFFNPETGDLIDLKTCADIDRFRFDIRDFGYAYQLAFYRKVLALAGYEKPVKCYLVAVEKKEPYRVAVINVCESTIGDLNEGHMAGENLRDDNDFVIEELKNFQKTNVWPTRYENVIVI